MKVFIDGKEGTTGLRIFERLEGRSDLELLTLPEDKRKDEAARKVAINSCDIVILCLPDGPAKEAISLVENENVAIIDASTAHRTAEGWTYGFSQISKSQEDAIKSSKRIANPGCHASGFIALVSPLIEAGVLARNANLSCTSITGYSGGGKSMIADYQSENKDEDLFAPRIYANTQSHKHLAEMVHVCGLQNPPIFQPIVSDFYSGMLVSVPIFAKDISCSVQELKEIYKAKYNGDIVKYSEELECESFISASSHSGCDGMEIAVRGNEERIVLTARYDNLGKGASGSCVESVNMLLGKNNNIGLKLK